MWRVFKNLILEIYVAGPYFCEILKHNLPKITPLSLKKISQKAASWGPVSPQKSETGTSQENELDYVALLTTQIVCIPLLNIFNYKFNYIVVLHC